MSEAETVKKLTDATATLKKVQEEIKPLAEKALKEAENAVSMSKEDRTKVDETLNQLGVLTTLVNEATEKLEGLETSNLEVMQNLSNLGGGAAGQSRRETLGEALAKNEKIADYVKNGNSGSLSISVENAITTADGSAGGLIEPTRESGEIALPYQKLSLRQLLSQGGTDSNLVQYARQVTRTNAAAIVAEGGTKPESVYEWELAEASVRDIAHVANISKQAMSDAKQLKTMVDTEMRYGLDLSEEAQIFGGDGVAPNLEGLVTAATAFSAAAGLPDETRIDRIRLAILQVALGNYAADGIVLNPTDWAAIDLLKDTTDQYIYGNPHTSGSPVLWGLPVVESQTAAPGEWLVGAFKMAATIYDRELTEVLISSEHSDNFVKNMLTMRAEKRIALAIKRPASLVTGDFTFA